MHSTDAKLIARAQTDPQAFRELYDRYAVWIRTWLERQTGSESAALDLTAETFAQAWNSIARFRDESDGSAAPWLFGIARNLSRQFHRVNRVETAARQRLGMAMPSSQPDEFDRIDERLEAARMGPALRVAMEELPADQRDALHLRIIDQLGYPEVASRLGCTQNAARTRVSRGLRSMAASFEGGLA